ncbi:MAG: hypothetical protein L6Q37_13260 [Bdellovibrionaceae bacterium]|nr:hypothetical protein [Pseudobdellovibrionaceae bacterium]
MSRRQLLSQRSKKTLLAFLFISLLVVPFQNCKKFDTSENSVSATSDDGSYSSNDPSNTTKEPSPQLPTQTTPIDTADPAVVAAENARQERCRNNIKKPVIVNANDVSNFVFNLSSGLSTAGGDLNSTENKDITVDPSKGIIDLSLTTPQLSGGDGCSYVTSLRIDAVNDASRPAELKNAINFSGVSVVTQDSATNFGIAKATIASNPNNNNNNNFATNTLNLKFTIVNNNNRDYRCVEGSLWYAVKVRVSTQSLPNNKQLESDPVYIKANITNSCWKENKLKASNDFPLNAKAGSKVSLDGNWAAVLSPSDSNKGAVFLFTKNPSNEWIFSQKLVMPDSASGQNLSNLDLKGNILAVSNSGYASKGKVYIFKNVNSSWSFVQGIDAYENTVLYQQFGQGLALSSNSLTIGAPSHPKSGAAESDTGKVYVYNYNSGSGLFEYNQTLEGSNEPHFGFGKVIQNYNNSKLIIGAPDSVNGSTGRVFVFNKSSIWSQELAIAPPSSITQSATFGAAIAFNGTALVVGAPYDDRDANNLDRGSVFYYKNYNSSVFHTMKGASLVCLWL